MRVRNFEHCTAELGTLSKRQREKVLPLLNQVSQQERVAEGMEQAAAANLGCPRRRSTQCHLHGRADDWQRFRCRRCGKTFNSLTDTPLARLRRKSITKADEMYLLESKKGARHLERPAQARRPGEQAGHIERTGPHFGGP